MNKQNTLELAHRTAWRYKKSSDPHHSDTYTFNENTLLQFADQVVKANGSMDTKRMDWLADPDNKIGNVMLPQECVEAGLLDGLRGMIDEAMELDNE